MVCIGEKKMTLQRYKSDISKITKKSEELSQRLSEAKEVVRKLEMEPELAVKVLVAIEDHTSLNYNLIRSDDICWYGIYYFPDTDMVYNCRDWSWGKKALFDNEIDLSSFYKSGCDTLEVKLPFSEHFYGNAKYKKVIDNAIQDVKARIERILVRNDNITDWELVGKLLLASYYKY